VRLVSIHDRGMRASCGVRVVRPNDLEAARACHADGREVILRAHEIPGRGLVEVLGTMYHLDGGTRADQKTATLERRFVSCVTGNFTQQAVSDDHASHGGRYAIRSTTIATPIPPPMHNDATPYLACRWHIAYSSVVSTRAPLAPIG
jgi:hypothetical protein